MSVDRYGSMQCLEPTGQVTGTAGSGYHRLEGCEESGVLADTGEVCQTASGAAESRDGCGFLLGYSLVCGFAGGGRFKQNVQHMLEDLRGSGQRREEQPGRR